MRKSSAILLVVATISLTTTFTNAVRVKNPVPPLHVRRCGFLRYTIPADTFTDVVDGDTRNLELSLYNSSRGELTENDWVSFDTKNQTLYAVLTDRVLKTARIHSTYFFHLIAKTKRGESTFNTITLVLTEEWRNTSSSFLVNFWWMAQNKPSLVEIQVLFAEKLMKYLEMPIERMRFTHFLPNGLQYAIGFTNCTDNSEKCSLDGTKGFENKLYTQMGTVPAFRDSMQPEIYVSYIQETVAPECQPKVGPRVEKPFPPVTAFPCSSINSSLPYDVFYDEEDGYNLRLSIHAVNGRASGNETSWLEINQGSKRLEGVVTEQAIREQPNGGYNLTIRAYDSQSLWAETYLILKIAERPLQKFYQFTLHLTAIGNAFRSQFYRQTLLVRFINSFFKASFINIMSYNKINEGDFTVRASICTLPSKCDEASFASIFNKMATNSSAPTENFSRAFLGVFTIKSVTSIVDPICKQVLEPPVPMINPWIVSVSNCGGLKIQVPAGLFFDKQDGDLRSLSLELYLNDKKVTKTGWVQLNSTSQVLHLLPTDEDIAAYQVSGNQNYKLVATDKSGLNSSLELKVSIPPIRSSTYKYMIVYRQSGFSNTLNELAAFSEKLSKYLGFHWRSSITIEKVSYLSSETRRIYYRNCTSSFDPCDASQTNQINSMLFVPSLNPDFKTAMEPEFKILLMSATNSTTDCHVNRPPMVEHPIPLLLISVCGLRNFSLPAYTFDDREDGETPKLKVSLTDSNNNSLSMNSWVQWIPEKQIIRFMGNVASAKSRERETFLLTATDKGGLSTQLSIFTSMSGPLDILSDCQIRTKFQIDKSLSAKSNVFLTDMILSTMVKYFGLESLSRIGIVSLQRDISTSIMISWSYCAPTYTHYTQSSLAYQSIVNSPDFRGLSLLLRRMFVPGSYYLHPEFKSIFQGVTVGLVIRAFSGKCSSFPPIIGLHQQYISFNVSSNGVTKILVGKHWFYDLEDGDAHQLKLELVDHLRAKITGFERWIGFERTSKMILISITDKERRMGLSTASFYLTATDSSGKVAELPLTINIIQSKLRTPLYRITLYFINKIKVSYQNDSSFIADRIAEAYSLTSTAGIVLHSFHQDSGYVDSSSFVWSSSEQNTCTSGLFQKAKDHQGSEGAFNELKGKFLPRFELQRTVIRHSCGGSLTSPSSHISYIRFNVKMYGISVYNIPHSIFYDTVDGNTKNMKVFLLDSQRQNVSSTSWIQLHPATLQLYAIMISSTGAQVGTSRFYLQGVNSRGLSTELQVNINVSEEPYTNDCPITIIVKQKIGPEHLVDLNILNKLLEVISKFYNDKEIKIKVLEFRKISGYSYSLKYSNCSFTFPTKDAARKGYDEPFRSTLNEMFYKLVKPDGTIQPAFSSFLSSSFDVESVAVSYECIEASPYPTIAVVHSIARTCKEFRVVISKTIFNDARDGTNLKYSLVYPSGRQLSLSEWIAFDEKRKEVYGMVTEDVKRRAPSLGYEYRIVATDSAGRSANITYRIFIENPLPYMPIKIIIAYNSTFNDTSATADVLVDISRKIASRLDGASKADEILINSVNLGKSITFSHCKLSCTEADYMRLSTKLQKLTFSSEPSDSFKLASMASFVPERVYLDGSSCVPISKITTIVRKVVTFTLQKVCGFVEHEIPDDVFTDKNGRSSKDFILSMNLLGKGLSFSTTAFVFDRGFQSFYGPVIPSRINRQVIYNLEAKNPQSGLTGATSFILNAPDLQTFGAISKSLCVVSATVSTSINTAYSDAHIIKRFMGIIARYLNLTLQEIQIISYTRKVENPVEFVISFANCHWYTWIRANSTSEMRSQYMKSRDNAMMAMFANAKQTTLVNANFYSALSPYFKLVNLSANDWCKKLPNMHPVVNKTVVNITARACSRFHYQVPGHTFSDEDGNARDLKLQLYHANGSSLMASDWVSFDEVTQTIYGSPTKRAHKENNGVHSYMLTATDQYGLATTTNVIIEISGSAPGNEAPTINLANFQITLPSCGIYRSTLPDNFATDKEDGSMKNLRVNMKMADGSAIPHDSWIQFDYNTHELYTLATGHGRSSSGSEFQYMIIVTDSCGGVATGPIRIITQRSSDYYYAHKFQFQSLQKANLPYLDIQIAFLGFLSKYCNDFASSFKTLSFAKLAGTEIYEYNFANCSTKAYVCPNTNTYYQGGQKIFTESTKLMNSFATYLSSSFRIISYQNQTNYQIKPPPQSNSSSLIEIEVTSCGGYDYNMTKHFKDKGDLRYKINFQNGTAIPLSYPIQIASSMLKIIPLGSKSSGTHFVRVTAFDNCNQSTYKDIKVRIGNETSHSGYQISLESKVTSGVSTVHYISQFQTALQIQLKNPKYDIEIEGYSRSQGILAFTWKSCYEMKDKCNKSNIIYLHSQLFTAANITSPVFQRRLGETFSNPKLTEYQHHCNFISYEPPKSSRSLDIVTDICRNMEVRIPANVFSDKEDGDARNLRLSLFTENNKQLPFEHWLQFDRITQTMYGYPRFVSSLTFKRSYKYNLVASDIKGNTASTPVSVQIRGSTTVTYRLTINGVVKYDKHRSNVDYELSLIRKIGVFFNDSHINDISLKRNGTAFVFSWSFCRVATSKCDCFFIKRIESQIENNKEIKKIMEPEFELVKITSTRHGVCSSQKIPQALMDKKEVYITGGQAFTEAIHNSHFYDFEDGYTNNLTLYMTDSNNEIVTTSHWVKLNKQHVCGLVTLSQLQSSEWALSSSRNYTLVARDACGKEVRDSFSVVMNHSRESLSFSINVYVTNAYLNVTSNCTKMQQFTHLVSSYINASDSDFLIQNVDTYVLKGNNASDTANYTVIVWGLRNFTGNCSSHTISSYREKFLYHNGSIKRAFYDHMKIDFDVVKVDLNTTACSNGTFVPIILPPVSSDFVFPLWILIFLLVLAILIMLCWLCWICIPRCCPACSMGCIHKQLWCCSSLCGKCCMPGGKYASMDKADLAPDIEGGVLSNARAEPKSSQEKAGKAVDPDDVEIAAAAEEEPNPSKIEEDEMLMDTNTAPGLFAAPDYMANKQAPYNGLDDGYEEPSPNEMMGPGTVPSLFTAPDYLRINSRREKALDDSYDEPSPSMMGPGAGPISDNVMDMVAAMPNEQAQDSEMSGYAQSEGYSSIASSRYETDDVQLAPFPNELHEYDFPQGSYSEESYSRNDAESELQQTMDVLPMSQAIAPSLASMPKSDRKLSLPQMPNVFSEHDKVPQAIQVPRPSVVTNSRDASQRRMSSVSTQYFRKGNVVGEHKARRMSMTRPEVMATQRDSMSVFMDGNGYERKSNGIASKQSNRRRSSQFALQDYEDYDIGMSMMPEVTATQRDSVSVLMDGNGYETNSNSMASKRSNRRRSSQFALLDHEDYDSGMSVRPEVIATQRDSVSVLMDGNGYETNSNSMASKRSNRRRSSQFALLDHEDYDSGMGVANRKSSQTRRMSQVFLQQQPSRRVSRARLLSTEGYYGGSAPIEKSIIDSNFFQDIQGHSYKDSRMDNERLSSLQAQDRHDLQHHQLTGMATRARKISAPMRISNFADIAENGHGVGAGSARRMSLSARSVSQHLPVVSAESSNFKRFLAGSRKHSMGYESDSTDSGYAIRRSSKRYRQRSQQKVMYSGEDREGHDTDKIQVRRVSTTRRTSRGTRPGHTSQADYLEMWSRDQRNRMINPTYESDSFV